MSDEKPKAEQGPGPADPVAIGIALSRSSASIDEALTAYLHDQRHHLHEMLWQIHLDIAEKWLGLLLRAATLVVGLAVAGGLGLLVLQTVRSDGLKVEPFSVPPAMAERGLTGEVVAARVIDRLSELQSQTNTARPARSYSNAWGDKAIKLEIPETGVSLSELDSWLREKLGHETPLTGEVVRTANGVALTARTGTDGAVTVSGAEADMDVLTAKLAEAIYRLTQPYRYAIYLMRHESRPADAVPIFRELVQHGSPEDRRWSYNMWAQATEIAQANKELGLQMYQQARAADPDSTLPYTNLVWDLIRFNRVEEAAQAQREVLAKTDTSANSTDAGKARNGADLAMLTGAYHDALRIHAENLRTGVPGFPRQALLNRVLKDQIGEHDLAAARITLASDPVPSDSLSATDPGYAALQVAINVGNWHEALSHESAWNAFMTAYPQDRYFLLARFAPPLALAHAHLGDFAAAQSLIAQTRADCLTCLIARAQIAEMAGQHARADWWFNRATAASPSVPFAFEAEGRTLLERGQPDQAIARFIIANQKSLHFADALEGWGEALMAKHESHLALAKFVEAENYAPNWGRLHLKWGEALMWSGKREDAKAHFARATDLDLTPSEQSELGRHP